MRGADRHLPLLVPWTGKSAVGDWTMAYLDVSPMITALRERPDEFDMKHGWLRHTPSRHRYKFDSHGNVLFDTTCSCAMLSIRDEQTRQLHTAFTAWHQAYWQPLMINRQFASHFRPPGFWRRLYRRLLSSLRGQRQHRLPENVSPVAIRR
jgi:hypothetical protein